MNKINICIYNGPGVSKQNIVRMQRSLSESCIPHLNISLINHHKIKQTLLENCHLFILLGGRDKLYAKYLNGECNEIIKSYVKSGGSFLGICAGAYYSGTKVEFAKNSSKEVMENRELGFFNGTVIGPILCEYFYNSTKGSRAAKINVTDGYSYAHYNGGGYFEGHDDSAEVISYYQDVTPILPAIIKIQEGKGLAVLSGVHFEYCNTKDYSYTAEENIKLLKDYDEVNKKFFRELICSLINKM